MKNWLGRKIRVKVNPVGTRTIQHSANSGISGSADDCVRARRSPGETRTKRMTAKIAGARTSAIDVGSGAA